MYLNIYIYFIHVCVGASVRAHPENIALNGTVTSHPSPLHNDPPWKDKHPWDWSERNAPDGNTPNRLQSTYYRLFVWADGIWGTKMKTYANYRHNAPYSWTFSGKRTPRTEDGKPLRKTRVCRLAVFLVVSRFLRGWTCPEKQRGHKIWTDNLGTKQNGQP